MNACTEEITEQGPPSNCNNADFSCELNKKPFEI